SRSRAPPRPRLRSPSRSRPEATRQEPTEAHLQPLALHLQHAATMAHRGTNAGRVRGCDGAPAGPGAPDDAPTAGDRVRGDADAGPHLPRPGGANDPGRDAGGERVDDLSNPEP